MKKIILSILSVSLACGAMAQDFIKFGDLTFEAQDVKRFSYGVDEGTLPYQIMKDPNATIFGEAIQKTELYKLMWNAKDWGYEPEDRIDRFYFRNINWEGKPAPSKQYGYTGFIVPDSILKKTYGISDLKGLYDKACALYDEVYPEDVKEPGHSFECLTDSINPLYRLLAYHFLNRNLKKYGEYPLNGEMIAPEVNPTEWYQTLLPYSMLKMEIISKTWIINHSSKYEVEGTSVEKTTESIELMICSNGCYYYIDKLLAFDHETRNKVLNSRQRYDFIAYFPELTNNGIRESSMNNTNHVTGSSYGDYNPCCYIPDGYIQDLKYLSDSQELFCAYPFWCSSLNRDWFILKGTIDCLVKLPPVPFDGIWQIRYGYNAGAAQQYLRFDIGEDPENLTEVGVYDLRPYLGEYLAKCGIEELQYSYEMTKEERAEQRKLLMTQGILRGPAGYYHVNSDQSFYDSSYGMCLRRIVCSVPMKAGKDYYLRITNNIPANDNAAEMYLDYFELVPQNVYEGDEDDY